MGLDKESSLCTTGHGANILTGILVRLLQEHFSNPANLEYNGENEFRVNSMLPLRQLQGYVWNSDSKQTKIQIQTVWDYNAEDIQNRPALYVKRNTMQPQKIAIADGFTFGARRDKVTGKLLEVRGDYKAIQVLGSHTVFCVGHSGAEAELLGAEVTNQLIGFAPLIREDMKFNRFTVLEVGEVALLDEFDSHFVVPVVVGYGFPYAWRIQQIAPWLKTLSISSVPN